MQLADLQAALAASLAGGGAAPPGCSAAAIERARRALADKRGRAARRLLPRTAAALQRDWPDCFHRHAARFTPGAMLYHVDDAWELAARLAARAPVAGEDPAAASRVREAAHDDLVELRLRFARGRRPGSRRIRVRRGPLVAWISTPRRTLLIRLPGRAGLVWRWPAPAGPTIAPSRS